MKTLKTKKASILATFSNSYQLSERLKVALEKMGKTSHRLTSSAYVSGLMISDNKAGDVLVQKWDSKQVKGNKNDAQFFLVEYAIIQETCSLGLPVFCN